MRIPRPLQAGQSLVFIGCNRSYTQVKPLGFFSALILTRSAVALAMFKRRASRCALVPRFPPSLPSATAALFFICQYRDRSCK